MRPGSASRPAASIVRVERTSPLLGGVRAERDDASVFDDDVRTRPFAVGVVQREDMRAPDQ